MYTTCIMTHSSVSGQESHVAHTVSTALVKNTVEAISTKSI